IDRVLFCAPILTNEIHGTFKHSVRRDAHKRKTHEKPGVDRHKAIRSRNSHAYRAWLLGRDHSLAA
ncbi:MAG: hypothetical protein WBM61_09180, partial [Woeseiaceae bacterium]